MITTREAAVFICSYETDGGRNATPWTGVPATANRFLSHFIDEMQAENQRLIDRWVASRRPFTEGELYAGPWLKLTDAGQTTLVWFHQNHTLTEARFFDQKAKWEGTWELSPDSLQLAIGGWYVALFAAAGSALHTGIDFQGQPMSSQRPWSYLRFFQAPR